MPNILQDAKKRDDKARTFAPPDNTDEEKKALKELTRLKYPDDSIELNLNKKVFGKIKKPEDLKRDKFFENINKYEDINLNDVNTLIDEIKKKYIKMGDNILDLGDNKFAYFNHINDFLHDIKDGNINNFNREKNIKKSLKILKTSSQIEKNMVNMINV